MYALLSLGFAAFLLCFILTPVVRDVFLKLDLVDVADCDRKTHEGRIPRIGGIAIVLSYVAALGTMLFFAPHGASIAVQHKELLWSLFPAAGFIFLIGLIDDLIRLRAWFKLAGQVVAAVWAVSMGARIPLFAGHEAAWVTWPLSVFWLVGCTNAFNLIDGLDGLASGVGLFATLTTLLAALIQGNWGLAMATVPLAGCLLAFLRYNFNPASVFLGDSGSLTIGFLLGCFGVIWSQKSATLLGMVAPLMAFSLPLFEVALSIVRRSLRSQPIFQPDRGHIHHRLLDLGLHPRAAALILYGACGVAAILSLLQSSLGYHLGGLIITLFSLLAFFGIQRLGYVEFSTASRVLRQGRIMQMLQGEIHLQNFRTAIAEANTASDCWQVVRSACEKLGFCSVRLKISGESFYHSFADSRLEYSWQLSITLRGGGQVFLTRTSEQHQPVLTSFLHLLQESLESKQSQSEISLAS